MNKQEQINWIASKAGLTKEMASVAYNAFVDAVTESVTKDGEASITGLGKFVASTVKERTVRNPKTGKPVVVPQHTKVAFKVSSALKNIVNGI